MNKSEMVKLIVLIKTAYSRYFISSDKSETDMLANVWFDMFKEDKYEIVEQAIKALMATLKYPPTIADVKEKIAFITQSEELIEMEAWNLVFKALRNSGYYSEAEFKKLPAIIQKIIGSPSQLLEYSQLDLNALTVVQSNFMRSYKAFTERGRLYKMLPESTKSLITDLKQAKALEDN